MKLFIERGDWTDVVHSPTTLVTPDDKEPSNYKIKAFDSDEFSRVYYRGDTPYIRHYTKNNSVMIDVLDPILVSIVKKG